MNAGAILEKAEKAGPLLPEALKNLRFYLTGAGVEDWERESVGELVERGEWTELNDRFYTTLKFGTGGLRGRTIGRVVTSVEMGGADGKPPRHPAAGMNVMNEFNLSRATQGLAAYVKKVFPGEAPRVVFSHDTRYFSRGFAELGAEVVRRLGGVAYLMESERSTPELSFAVRHCGAHAGVMITASHNPPHDNGYKAYFADGAQMVEPHASGVIAEVQQISTGRLPDDAGGGRVELLGAELDAAYEKALEELILDREVVKDQAALVKVVFTPIHGTGMKTVPGLLQRQGFAVTVVEAQAKGDGGFPTVKSPNPEYPEALALALVEARRVEADFLAATDPDADRMGVALRRPDGEYEIITGNQIGSILAAYRIGRLYEQGVLTAANAGRAAVIKTFVTTDLQKIIAERHGLKCIETLTGFKYIGEKLGIYETEVGGRQSRDAKAWRSVLLEQGTYFVFGGEESYGYLAEDYARDKDANAAVLMFAEAAAWARARGTTLWKFLQFLYTSYGLYLEKLGTLTFEGAEGAAKIQQLLKSYLESPPVELHGRRVERVQNFAADDIRDADGKLVPKEGMLMFHLAGGFRMAVRASGTEPKIKYYFFGRADVPERDGLEEVKGRLKGELEGLWEAVQGDARARAGG